MRDSLFLSAAFITVEIGFVAASLIAAYELWIEDFVWGNEEKQREAIQSQRGGGMGYEPLYNTTTRREYYDRSLSGAQKDTRRRGSTGDSTRRLFYKLILIALLCRLISFPIETYSVSTNQLTESNKIETKPLLWVLLRVSQTLPEIAFASAYGLLIIFMAQIAFTALPLSPQVSGDSLGADDPETAGNENSSPQPTRDDRVSDYGFNQQQNARMNKVGTDDESQPNLLQTVSHFCAHCVRRTLASKRVFCIWNTILLVLFSTIVSLATTTISLDEFEFCLWFLLIGVYSVLSLVLIYVSAMLIKALQPGMLQRKGTNTLTLRLIGMCTLLVCVFLDRLISFGIAAERTSIPLNNEQGGEQRGSNLISLSVYRKNSIKYAFFELLPVLMILLIMHRKKKEPNRQNEVLIIHSIMNNIFGSNARLGNEQIDGPAPSGSSGKGGGLGSRRFQTYHGSTARADSFPPKVTKQGGNASKMSSLGGTSKDSSPLLTR
jgi:hypothetical protein